MGRILFLIFLFPTLILAQSARIPDGWSDNYVYANGIRIHYYQAIQQPGKPVMVLVHGVTDNGLGWTTLTWKLQDMYNIYMLDARGHGLSDPFTPGDDSETLVKDVVEFVKIMKFNKPILMGHSMGAATVIRVGAEYPEIARALIMLDPLLHRITSPSSPNEQPKEAQQKSSARTESRPNRISLGMFGSPEKLVAQNNYTFSELIEEGKRQNPLWDKVDIEYWALAKKQYHGPYTPEAAQVMTATMNISNALPNIQVPSIILKADASAEVRRSNEYTAAAIPHGKIVHIDGAGHSVHHDKLDRTIEVIKDFLSAL